MTLFDDPADELEQAQREIKELEAICQALVRSVADLVTAVEALILDEEAPQIQGLQA